MWEKITWEEGEEERGGAGDRVWIRSEKTLGKGAFCGGVGSDHKTVKIAKITLVLQRKRPEQRIIIKTR